MGTWESRFDTDQGGWVWTWAIASDGSYRWTTKGPIPLPEENGRMVASGGRFRRSAEGREDVGNYELRDGTLILVTPSFTQRWTRVH
jgi:hypothetical protein